jgi:hypothetical protein
MSLELSLSLEKERLHVKALAIVKVVLHNVSDQPLTVNGRMLLNHSSAPEPMRDISFDIVGPPGYFSLTVFHINAGRPGPEHFVELKPGESLERTYKLTKYYSLHSPGKYSVQVTYLNVTPHYAFGRRAWTGSVSSDWVTLERID